MAAILPNPGHAPRDMPCRCARDSPQRHVQECLAAASGTPHRRGRRKPEPAGPSGVLRPEERQTLLAGLTDPAFTPQKPRRFGPMPGARELLDSYGTRRPACPACGRRQLIHQWYTQDWAHFYNVFTCPAHGKHLCCLTMSMRRAGCSWAGSLSVPVVDGKQLAAFEAALHFQPHRCRLRQNSTGKKKQKRM